MYVGMQIYVFVFMQAGGYVRRYVYMQVGIYVCLSVCLFVCMYIWRGGYHGGVGGRWTGSYIYIYHVFVKGSLEVYISVFQSFASQQTGWSQQ